MSERLRGKIAIVTGAGSGIGKAAAALFSREGATVVAADLQGTEVAVDAGDEGQMAALITATVDRCGGLDVMFANAGVSGGVAALFEQDAADWQRILQTNLIGPFLAIKYAAPAIARRGGGSIICTASVAGLRSGAGGPAYSASKAGVINLVQVAAQQLSGFRGAGQCAVSGADRDRNDAAGFRSGAQCRQGGSHRTPESVAAQRPA